MDSDALSLVLLAVGLAMDAFSVAVATGFGLKKVPLDEASRLSTVFGAFHVFMPVVGYAAGSTIVWLIANYDHWAAFLLLCFIGIRMIHKSFKQESIELSKLLSPASLVVFSIAVSLDTVAAGLSLSFEKIPILVPAILIGATCFAFTFIGIIVGSKVGRLAERVAPLIGGTVLIAIGVRILLSHIL